MLMISSASDNKYMTNFNDTQLPAMRVISRMQIPNVHLFNLQKVIRLWSAFILKYHYSLEASKKLHPRNASPFKIVKKINSQTYVLDLPSDLAVDPTSNAEDLTTYHGHHVDEEDENKFSTFQQFHHIRT